MCGGVMCGDAICGVCGMCDVWSVGYDVGMRA